ncbi:beta-mannosidase [Photobacterium jeanii]|uniref:beta-mannosidase n=1 Tax=Photobacterium jeanii TaxID=858640 RepID=A0A178K8Y8_9GAMM|nr:sugar-binding domain-containing protein [Photobacterium jeanii]OAN13798.1 beta-mannosidase [Photobacterium jeanii]PST92740.1 beta-mannosidase [Photobacterium jeanii]
MRIAFAMMALFSLSSCAIQQPNNDWQTSEQSLNGLWRLEIIDEQQRQSVIHEVNVPNNWFLEGIDHAGTGIYSRQLALNNKPSQSRYWLQFSAVDYEAKVSLNNQDVISHLGYFSPFTAEVTSLISEGANQLQVWVNSPDDPKDADWSLYKNQIKGVLNHHDTRPGGAWSDDGQDRNSGGIWGDVNLRQTGPIAVQHLAAIPHVELAATTQSSVSERTSALTSADVRFQLDNLAQQEAELRYTLWREGLDSQTEPTESYQQTVQLSQGKQTIYWQLPEKERLLWWPWDWGEPNLYRIQLEVLINDKVSDTYQASIGFRDFAFNEDKGEFYVNGLPYFIRGTNYIGSQWLAEMTAGDYQNDLNLMRQANINSVRVHAHVAGEDFYHQADKAGILVWQDFPLQWGYSDSDTFRQQAVEQTKAMTDMLANHASIAFWCGHNEPPWDADWMKYKYPSYQSAQNKQLTQAVYQTLLAANDKRIVREASYTKEHPWLGWYSGKYQDYKTAQFTPIVSEFGAQAMPSLAMIEAILSDVGITPNEWPLSKKALATLSYHNYQPHETLMIAKVPQGESLSQFHQNTQEYQRVVTKYAAEHLRLNKGQGVAAIYQFMFVDSWPAITWSVIDVNRQTKPAYEALKQAYQPLLAVIERDVTQADGQVSITIINDSLQSYSKAKLWIKNQYDNKQWLVENINIAANTQQQVVTNQVFAGLSGYLSLVLTDESGNELSQNHYKLQD